MIDAGLRALFEREHIFSIGVLPFSECRVTNARLYESIGFLPQSALVFLIPYFSVQPDNFSAYAAAEDYHFYAKELYARMEAELKHLYPDGDFLCFSDHSPIDEVSAAVCAGLGVFGKNRLFISKEYGTYQFIGEFLSTLPPDAFGEATVFPPLTCIGCDACLRACPTGILRNESDVCLSAITQRKGELSAEESALMRKVNTAWGCDECQRVCPYNKEAFHRGTAFTEIPFFKENLITHLDTRTVEEMPKEVFSRRAFAWRGQKTVLRNTRILEEK